MSGRAYCGRVFKVRDLVSALLLRDIDPLLVGGLCSIYGFGPPH